MSVHSISRGRKHPGVRPATSDVTPNSARAPAGNGSARAIFSASCLLTWRKSGQGGANPFRMLGEHGSVGQIAAMTS